MAKSLAIVDGDGLLFRAVSKVKNVEAAYKKYMKILHGYVRDSECEKAIIYCEGKGNWRKDLFTGYKANRRPKGQVIDAQMIMLLELKDLLFDSKVAIPAIGCETDDLVRRRAHLCMQRDQDYMVISADKDLDMIIGPHMRVNQYGETKYYIIDEKMSDYNYFKQIMIGDMGDNIKSPYLLGPKLAEKILKTNNRKNWRTLIEKEYKDRCGKDWEHALYFTGSLIHIQRFKDDMFNWNKEGTWFDKKFQGAPSCYKYTTIQLGG